MTKINPITSEIFPELIESWPKSGPTVLSSTIFIGTGNAPDLSNKAKSVASWKEKFPEIDPLPPVIGSRTLGALMIFPSNMIAILLPTLSVVDLANFFDPILSKEK